MPTPDKILLRKIKKREKNKLKLIAKKNNNEAVKTTEEPEVCNTEVQTIHPDEGPKARHKKKALNTEDQAIHQDEGPSTPHKKKAEVLNTEAQMIHPDEVASAPHKKKKKKKIKVEDTPVDIKEESPNNSDAETAKQEDGDSKPRDESEILRACLETLTDRRYASLGDKLCKQTQMALKDMGITTMTEIQAETILPLLEGYFLSGAAKTGAGKTLAFLVPVVDRIYRLGFKPRNGTGAIILSPTRELAMQTFGVLMELMKYHRQTYGLVMGGANRKKEAQKLFNGVNILVATPGRLLDHMRNTPYFVYKSVMCLVIDEVDRMLEIGFEEEVKQIVTLLTKTLKLPVLRQTILFSATQTQKTDALATFVMQGEKYMYVGVDDDGEQATVDSLEQGFLECPSEKRLLVLFTFLARSRNKKVMVFFSTCMSVKYHHKLFNYIDLPVMSIHGKQEQSQRTTTFFQFCNAESGVLLCTDVAARGLDIPAVDWIVQYDPPDDPKEYIHRVGRTARGLGTSGRAVMFLRSEELGFLRFLKQAKVILNEYEYCCDQVADIQLQLEQLISRNYTLNKYAKEAFRSYLRAYDSHRLKTIFDMNTLDLAEVCKSFGFAVPPAVELNGAQNRSTNKRNGGGGYGYNKSFNAPDSYKKKAEKTKMYRNKGDNRNNRNSN